MLTALLNRPPAKRAPSAGAITRQVFQSLEPERRRLAAMDGEILDTQLAVSRIPAPTGREQHRAGWVAQRLRDSGLDVRSDDVGNVIAHAPSSTSASPVVVAAHLDTVFPMETLQFTRAGSRIIGPGISDNGRGLAAMLAIARVLSRSSGVRVARPVEFVATVSEEGAGDLRGARHYLATNEKPFAFIAIDGHGDQHVVTSAPGSRRFRVSYCGPGGHSWAAYGIANPVHAASHAASTMANLRLPRSARSTLSVTRIGGGMSVNAIAQDAWLEVDTRSMSEEALARLEREVRDVARAAAMTENDRRAPGTPMLTVTVETIGARPGGQTPVDSPLAAAALEATRLIGRSPELATASTDANAAMAAGVPAIAIGGGGRGGDTHTEREWFEAEGSSAGIQRALAIVSAVRGLT